MSQPPYAASPSPSKPRPSGWWFAVGALLIVVAIAIGVAVLVVTIKDFTRTEATIDNDGTAVTLHLDAGTTYLVWDDERQGDSCTILDKATGKSVPTAGLGSTSYTKSGGSGSWVGERTFDPGSGDVSVTCAADGGPIQVGEKPHLAGFLGGIAVTILVPLLLGGLGIVVLVVTTILFVVRPSRRKPGSAG